jgi:hypothetical protein
MSYFVVNHVSDTTKTEGLVESYQMVTLQNEDGTLVSKRINFVHWPAYPNPFVHEEWSESLVFANVYVPEEDNVEEEEEDENAETWESMCAILENDYPEVFDALYKEATAEEIEEDKAEED